MSSSRYRFCPKCANNFSNYSSFTERVDGKLINKLKYYCSACLHEEEGEKIQTPQDAILFKNTSLNKKPDREVNPDMSYDPTLSRTTLGDCPNAECESNLKKIKSEKLMFSRNQEDNMGFLCTACQSVWNV